MFPPRYTKYAVLKTLEIDITWPHMNKVAYIKFPYLLMHGVGRDPEYFR